jgi:protein-S-isoprenylcysteine O-methyltransferase Ste14
MSAATAFFTRWRVRLSYLLALAVFWFARPVPRMILLGGCIGTLGLLMRAYAAGCLHKQEMLTVFGPYAYTRNPLYFGSAILTAGLAIAAHSWISAALLLGYFALFYSMVMRNEEEELRRHFGAVYDDYAHAVPLFLPRLTPAPMAAEEGAAFSWAQYRKNREYQAAFGFVLIVGLLVLLWAARLP